jgi:hypothetical protein
MFVRAALGVISIVVTFATKSTLKKEILANNPTADQARLNSLLNTAITVGIVIGIVFLVLYVLLAIQVRSGKNWARIVTLVLAVLGAISGLASLATTEPALSHILGVVTALVDIAIIFFLSRRPSGQYFSSTPYSA